MIAITTITITATGTIQLELSFSEKHVGLMVVSLADLSRIPSSFFRIVKMDGGVVVVVVLVEVVFVSSESIFFSNVIV